MDPGTRTAKAKAGAARRVGTRISSERERSRVLAQGVCAQRGGAGGATAEPAGPAGALWKKVMKRGVNARGFG